MDGIQMQETAFMQFLMYELRRQLRIFISPTRWCNRAMSKENVSGRATAREKRFELQLPPLNKYDEVRLWGQSETASHKKGNEFTQTRHHLSTDLHGQTGSNVFNHAATHFCSGEIHSFSCGQYWACLCIRLLFVSSQSNPTGASSVYFRSVSYAASYI